jgi:uncharacterized membrane protein YccC
MIFSPEKIGLRFLLPDPGFVRLRMGCRALLTLTLVCLALVAIHRWFPMPVAAYAISMITAIQGIAAIKDSTPRARAITRIYAAIFGFCALAILTLLEQSLLQVSILLLVVIFLAVYARRFSTRWQAVGMFAFMCVVIGAFLKPKEIQLDAIAFALFLSGLIAHLVRNFVLPERADIDCKRAMQAASALIDKLSNEISTHARAGWSPADQHNALRLERRARDAILLCETYLPISPAGSFEDGAATELAARLFNLQLAMESALSKALAPTELNAGLTVALEEKLNLLKEAQINANAAIAATPANSFSAAIGRDRQVSLFPKAGEWFSDKIVRQAFQVTIASGIAMFAGVALSQERWFWAVLTAFLIFSNTRSRGDLAVKALNRAFGTAVGILAGMGLATLVHGELPLTMILVAISIFTAFYFASLSYSVMTFLITIAIALVYGLIGVFTPELLVLRLEETLIGVAAGIFVSLSVLPISTRKQVHQAMVHLLKALDQFLEDILKEDKSANLIASVRKLDKTQNEIRGAIGPMQSPWTFGLAQEKPRRTLIRTSMLVHAAHILAREFNNKVVSASEEEQLQSVRALLESLMQGNFDISGRSRITDMARLPDLNKNANFTKPVDYAFGVLTHVLRQADTRNQE